MKNDEKRREALGEKDLECIARFYQGVIFESDMFFGCRYCRFVKECYVTGNDGRIRNPASHMDVIREKMGRITGFDLGYMYNPDNPAGKFGAYQNSRSLATASNGHLSDEPHSSE